MYDFDTNLRKRKRASSLVEYQKHNYKENDENRRKSSKFSIHFMIVMCASIITRLLYVNSSDIVVWDEAHFGKFANWYIKQAFYFDVHPPLGKLLITFSGWIFGYKGKFAFESGSTYTDVPILQMRIFCALFGASVAPFIYGTCRNLKYNKTISMTIAMLNVFDNSLISISKFVLLDPILLSFTSMSLYGITRFDIEDTNVPFTKVWFKSLAFTGISLGLVVSVKWVGLFTYAFAGLFIIRQLWSKLPELRYRPGKYIKHFTYRALFLIILPLTIYMLTFYAHFTILRKTGTGDSHMSSRFQANLIGSKIASGAQYVTFQHSIVTLRNRGYGGGLLHSHPQTYPTGSKQGQVTLYNHRDDNNQWIIRKPWGSRDENDENEVKYLQDNDTIRLYHRNGKRNLHSHLIPAPISVYQQEVSVYGNLTVGDQNDHWIVEMDSRDKVTKLTSKFRLRHKSLGCYLGSSGERLPDWGFSQLEVVCTEKKSRRIEWNIEEIIDGTNDSDAQAKARTNTNDKSYSSSHFIEDFIDLNVAMWYGNNALTPKLGKKDILISMPYQWPFLTTGIRMCNWKFGTIKYYLIGNPLVWWTSSVTLIYFLLQLGTSALLNKINGYSLYNDTIYINNGLLLFAGWVLHYLPFFLMGRVTYLHHYFPSLVMSTLMVGHILQNTWRAKNILAIIMTLVTLTSFIFFSPFSYGFVGDSKDMRSRQWLSSWNIFDM